MDSKLDIKQNTPTVEITSVPWLETLAIPVKNSPEILQFFANRFSPGLYANFKINQLVALGRSPLEANYTLLNKAKENESDEPQLLILYTIEGEHLYINSMSWDDRVGKWEVSHFPISLSSLKESSVDEMGIPVVLNLIHSHLRGLNQENPGSQVKMEQKKYVIINNECISACFEQITRFNETDNINAMSILVDACPKHPLALQIHRLIVDHCIAEATQDLQFRYMSTLSLLFKIAHKSFYIVAENEFQNGNIEKALRCLKISATNGYYYNELTERLFKSIELQAREGKSPMTLDKPSMDSASIKDILTGSNPLVFIRTATALGKAYLKGREEQSINSSLGKNGIFTPDTQTNDRSGTDLTTSTGNGLAL
jgi:hypothetical protein